MRIRPTAPGFSIRSSASSPPRFGSAPTTPYPRNPRRPACPPRRTTKTAPLGSLPPPLPHPGAPPIPVPSSDFFRRRSLLPKTRPQSRRRPSCRPIGRRRSPIPQMRPQSRRRTTLIPARLGLPSATLAPSRRCAAPPVAAPTRTSVLTSYGAAARERWQEVGAARARRGWCESGPGGLAPSSGQPRRQAPSWEVTPSALLHIVPTNLSLII